MKKIYVTAGFLTTFLLASLAGLAQTQSRSDIRKEIEDKRAELVALEKLFLEPGEGIECSMRSSCVNPTPG